MILLFSCQTSLKFNNDVPLNLEALFDGSSSQFPHPQHFQRFQLEGKHSEWQTLHQ